MTMSQQSIWQIICNSAVIKITHTLESLLICLDSNYKLIPWLKKFEKYTVYHLFECHEEFQY